MYKFWYDYIKAKYGDKEKRYYIDTDSFLFHSQQTFLVLQQIFLVYVLKTSWA